MADLEMADMAWLSASYAPAQHVHRWAVVMTRGPNMDSFDERGGGWVQHHDFCDDDVCVRRRIRFEWLEDSRG